MRQRDTERFRGHRKSDLADSLSEPEILMAKFLVCVDSHRRQMTAMVNSFMYSC